MRRSDRAVRSDLAERAGQWPRTSLRGSERVRAVRHRRLLVGGLVGVDDARCSRPCPAGATRRAARRAACSRSPESAASRKCRMAVFSDDRTLLLRRRATSLVRIRLIWDLMFATKEPRRCWLKVRVARPGWIGPQPARGRRATVPGYQRRSALPKSAAAGGRAQADGAHRDQLELRVQVGPHAVVAADDVGHRVVTRRPRRRRSSRCRRRSRSRRRPGRDR